jgi:hypothetical protein
VLLDIVVLAAALAEHQRRVTDHHHVAICEAVPADPPPADPGSVLRTKILDDPGRPDARQPRVLRRHPAVGQRDGENLRATALRALHPASVIATDLDPIDATQADPRARRLRLLTAHPDVERGSHTRGTRMRDDRTNGIGHTSRYRES